MKEFQERFTLLVLAGQQTARMSTRKSVCIRAVRASELIADFIGKGSLEDRTEKEVRALVDSIKRECSALDRKGYEKKVTDELIGKGLLDSVPAIIGCDLEYVTSGVDIMEYRADEEEYRDVFMGLRKAVLTDSELTEEDFLMLWLLRECSLSEVVENEEKTALEPKIEAYLKGKERSRILWKTSFRNVFEHTASEIIKAKQKLFRNPVMQGVAMFLTNVEKNEGIFIDTIDFGSTPSERRASVIDYVRERGHHVEEIETDGEHLLRIDNRYYRLFPGTRTYRLPVQGVYLVPVYGVVETV